MVTDAKLDEAERQDRSLNRWRIRAAITAALRAAAASFPDRWPTFVHPAASDQRPTFVHSAA